MSRIDPTLGADELSRLAEEAYAYAYATLVAYGFFYRQAMGPEAPEKQAINRFTHFRTLASPTFNNLVPWVNTDTLYSAVWLDLRAEPMVLSTPSFEAHRFQNIQSNDWHTMAFATHGTLDRGNGPRRYLFVGPGWAGDTPHGVDEVIACDTWIVKSFLRVLVEQPGDEPAIHALQDGFKLEPLSTYVGQPAPPPAPLDFRAPDPSGFVGPFFEVPSPAFIGWLNDLLRFAPIHADETALFQRFARLGVAPGAPAPEISDDQSHAIQQGIERARTSIAARLQHLGDPVNGWVYPLDLRGGRDVLAGSHERHVARAVTAKYAIWGPPADVVVYMTAETDAQGQVPDGSEHAYRIRFETAPPVDGFWSFTIYDADTRLLVAHPSGRYKRGDRDRDIVREANGGFTLYLQHEAPAEALRGNWLPAPKGRFQVVARLYSPQPPLLDGTWKPPALEKVQAS